MGMSKYSDDRYSHTISNPIHPNDWKPLRNGIERERWTLTREECSIKKPKTSRYPSLKGTDPKFRRNHRHALHGTMKALVRLAPTWQLHDLARSTLANSFLQKEKAEGKRETA